MKKVRKIIGTGGLGTGIFFLLEDNRDLGRNESRPAQRLNQRDFCKQHIILHYLGVILRDLRQPVEVLPIGAVGRDSAGEEVLQEMAAAGLSTAHVRTLDDASTLSAVCYLFPDRSGGNLTESRSACNRVSPKFIEQAWKKIRPKKSESMILAAPEVPLASRRRLLKLGRSVNAYNAASFVTQELPEVRKQGWLADVDLLALNAEEAAMLAGVSNRQSLEKIATACARVVQKLNPAIQLVVTGGAQGVIGMEGCESRALPGVKVKVRNTAGAGDSFLAGVMLGRLVGRPFLGPGEVTSLHVGRALSAMKVGAPHTINFDANLKSLRAFMRRQGESFP